MCRCEEPVSWDPHSSHSEIQTVVETIHVADPPLRRRAPLRHLRKNGLGAGKKQPDPFFRAVKTQTNGNGIAWETEISPSLITLAGKGKDSRSPHVLTMLRQIQGTRLCIAGNSHQNKTEKHFFSFLFFFFFFFTFSKKNKK